VALRRLLEFCLGVLGFVILILGIVVVGRLLSSIEGWVFCGILVLAWICLGALWRRIG
jgi:hypothetical protein